MGLATVFYPGLTTTLGGEMTLRRGIRPSIATVWIVPQDGLNLPPGTLTFNLDGTTIQFPDARIDTAFLRNEFTMERQRWAVQIADRRWRWKYGSIDGEYNVRLPDGTVDPNERKTPQELAMLCLAKLGGGDASQMPTGVWPYIKWVGKNPAEALQELCDMVACTVVLGLDNTVRIIPLGVGVDEGVLESGYPRHQRYRVTPRQRPQMLKVVCGPTRYQAKLATNAIARETDGEQKLLEDVDWAPDNILQESPWNFPSLTDDEERAAAFDSAWRWYRVAGVNEEDSWTVPGSSTRVTELKQLLPLYPDLVDTALDLDDIKRPLFPYVTGEFWAYGDGPNNTDEDHRYTGPFKLRRDRGVIEFPWPVFMLDDDQYLLEAEVAVMASFNIRNEDGDLDRVTRSAAVGGPAGEMVLMHPEIFAAKSPSVDTFSEAQAEADTYLAIFQRAFQGQWAQEREYAGFMAYSPDGNIAQVHWSCAHNRYVLTRVGFRGEFDVYNRTEAL
jgi:hypothetical protein